MPTSSPTTLYRPHELSYRTQYAEVKERSEGAGTLLPGTPGHMVFSTSADRAYWHRRYYPVPGGK